MSVKETTDENKLNQNEQQILDTALLESDQLLARSLRDDESRRLRRRLLLSALVLGVVVMSVLVLAIVSGWLAISAPVVAVAEEKIVGPSDQEWQDRLLSIRESDNWLVGAQAGMDLVKIPGDRPYEVLAKHWPRIAANGKKQILKGFTPGMMGNKEIHPRFFDVMHLGMTDKDAEVRSYAAAYIKMQGLPDFENDSKRYTSWRKRNKSHTAEEIVAAKPSNRNENSSLQDADALTAAGWKLLQSGELVAAEEKFTAAVKADPDAANAWNGLGWSRLNSGKSEHAVQAFEKCVALQPKHPAALNGLGQAFLSWKDYDKAEKYLLLAAPQASAAHHGLARLYLLTGEFKKALPWAKKLAASNNNTIAKQILDAAKSGKLDDDLRKRIEPSGKQKSYSEDATKGWQMFQSGRLHTAERLFRRALESDKENVSALNGLAFCLLNQGNYEQAKPLFEQCLALQKDAAGPMNGLARCLKAAGRVDDAVELWEQMAAEYPGPTAATTGLAQTYLERKEFAKAVEQYKILVESAPQNKAFQRGYQAAQQGSADE